MTVIDLFAGPGGWSVACQALGLHEIGFEWEPNTCATRRAAGHTTIRADLFDYPPQPSSGLIASPPCPAFSQAGTGNGLADIEPLQCVVSAPDRLAAADGDHWADPTSSLIVQAARWAHLATEWVAMEQVPAVLPVWRALAHGLLNDGWCSAWTGILNAADYGVPQTRRRAILIAHRTANVTPPEPTHTQDPQPSMFGALQPWVSMAAALGWDGTVGYNRGQGMTDRHGPKPPRATTQPAPTVTTHTGKDWVLQPGSDHFRSPRPIHEPAPALAFGHASSDWRWVLNTGRDRRPDGATQTRELDKPACTFTAMSGGQWTLERPATTIQGDPRVWPPGHKINQADIEQLGPRAAAERYSDRAGSKAIKVTTAEAATIQSFPPDYPFQGSKTAQFRQLGNAMPPTLAQAVLKAVA